MATRELDRIFEQSEPARAEDHDRELTLSFQSGDRWAYDSIFRRYSSRVQSVCYRMLSDPQDAQDAAQETFLRVYKALPRFNGQYQLGAWISRIATNVCLDYLRSRSRTPSDVAPNEVLEDSLKAPVGESPEEALLRTVEGMQVHETLASLSPLHRKAITMRDLEGRDYRDIATTLGVPEARARVLLHRARKGFKKSWSSASIFLALPVRLLQRLRRFRDPGVADPVLETANSATVGHVLTSSAQAASSCSPAVQSCTAVMSERIAAAATAALVGVGVTAAGGASIGLPRAKDIARPPAATAQSQVKDSFRLAARASTATVGAAAAVTNEVITQATTIGSEAATAVGLDVATSTDASTPVDDGATDAGVDSPSTLPEAPVDDATSPEGPSVADPGGVPSDAPSAEDPIATDPSAGSDDVAGDPLSSGPALDSDGVPIQDPSATPEPSASPSPAEEPAVTGPIPSESPSAESASSAEDAAAVSGDESGAVDGASNEATDADVPAQDTTPTPEPSATPSTTGDLLPAPSDGGGGD